MREDVPAWPPGGFSLNNNRAQPFRRSKSGGSPSDNRDIVFA